MDRRNFLMSGSVAALALAHEPALAAIDAAGGPAGDVALAPMLEAIFADGIAHSPEFATMLGLDSGKLAPLRSRLSEPTAADRAKTLARNQQWLGKLRGLDPATLGETARRNRALAIYQLEQRTLAPASFAMDSVQRPYRLTQRDGAYFDTPDFLNSQHPVSNADDAEAYLARLAQMAVVLDQESAEQRREAARGLAAPGWALDLTLAQMAKLRGDAPADSGLVRSLAGRTGAKNIAGDWAGRAAKIVESQVYPALDRQMALVRDLRRTTAEGDGAWRIPNGADIYAAALEQATTTRMTPQQVHSTGLEQVADISAQLDGILRDAGLTSGSVGDRLTALNQRPDQLYPNTDAGRAELIQGLNASAAAMWDRLPRAFNDVPRLPLEIRRVPAEIQDGASNGYYNSASLDGSRPAIYWINLKDTGDWPKYSLPALTYHEGTPGHHLQGSYAQQSGDLPSMLRHNFISSYGEGWALYAEQLSDELGAFSGIERAGYLQSFLFRAARLVVDTGLHHLRWSREKATAYMVATTGFAGPRSQREVERYCTSIGQACSYKIGHTAWLAQRKKAKDALGDKFSLPWFHDVLKEGVMPLSMLEIRIDERIRDRLRQG